jgi:ketosteroid isomerase-like protein
MRELAPFYSKASDVLIFNDVGPVKLRGWQEFKEAEDEIMARYSYWKVTPKEFRIRMWGDVALTTATPLLTGETKGGKKHSLTLRHTAVWERKDDGWLIVHDHWSIPWPLS